MKKTFQPNDTANENEYDQQAQSFLKETETTMTIKFKKFDRYFSDDKKSRNIYTIQLKNKNGSWSFPFGDSIHNTEKYRSATLPKDMQEHSPRPYDILACLNVDYSEGFQDFCENFGYDNDSPNAKRTFKAVQKETNNLQRMFSEAELELLHEVC